MRREAFRRNMAQQVTSPDTQQATGPTRAGRGERETTGRENARRKPSTHTLNRRNMAQQGLASLAGQERVRLGRRLLGLVRSSSGILPLHPRKPMETGILPLYREN